MLVPVRCFSYTPHADHSEEFLTPSLSLLSQREFYLSPRAGHLRGHTLCLHCSCTDDTDAVPHVTLRPNKDARARSDRLQLGTAHIQSFTQTRQVSVVMGMTRFLAAIGS